jgi:hypothetical protein
MALPNENVLSCFCANTGVKKKIGQSIEYKRHLHILLILQLHPKNHITLASAIKMAI